MSGNTDAPRITVTEGVALALAAGFRVSRPTVRKIFKDSGAATRLGGRFFMSRDTFLKILQDGDSNAAHQVEQPGTDGSGNGEAAGEA